MAASSSAITLHRELLEAIDYKLNPKSEDDKWPAIASVNTLPSPPRTENQNVSPTHSGAVSSSLTISPHEAIDDAPFRSYWSAVRDKYTSSGFLSVDQNEVDSLPSGWVVISINVTEDRNTMFISRHQAHRDPLVLTLPLDRQGRRDGEAEEDLFTFDTALEQLTEIIQESNDGRSTCLSDLYAHVVTRSTAS